MVKFDKHMYETLFFFQSTIRMDICTSITFSTATSSYAILLLPVKYSKTYKNKVWNTDVLRFLKVEFKTKGRVKAVRASIGNADVLRLLKVKLKPKEELRL